VYRLEHLVGRLLQTYFLNIYRKQARNQLGKPGVAISFLRGAQIF